MIQSFRRIKIDKNDTLYSQIIRFGETRCFRCHCVKSLQCAHIVGRGSKSTRFLLKPVRNAIPLCSDCHSWFDQSKDNTPVFNEESRPYFKKDKNAYVFLVSECGYSWRDIQYLVVTGNKPGKYGSFDKPVIFFQLKETIKKLEKEAHNVST